MTQEQQLFLAEVNTSLEEIQKLFDKYQLDIQFEIKPKNSTEESYHWTISRY